MSSIQSPMTYLPELYFSATYFRDILIRDTFPAIYLSATHIPAIYSSSAVYVRCSHDAVTPDILVGQYSNGRDRGHDVLGGRAGGRRVIVRVKFYCPHPHELHCVSLYFLFRMF